MSSQAAVENRFGAFIGTPVTEWLIDSQQPDRMMALKGDIAFRDKKQNRVWSAAAGQVVDGTSIPRALWTLIGSPFTGDYRRASIVHDIACYDFPKEGPERRAADRMFYSACRVGGCSALEAYYLYVGVRIGSLSTVALRWREPVADGPRTQETTTEVFVRSNYRVLAEDLTAGGVEELGPEDDPEVAERHLSELFRVYFNIEPDLT
jgi:hypothetical protein